MTLSGSTSSPDSGCSVGKKQYTERESKVTVPSVSSCFAQKELVHFNCKQITTHTHKKRPLSVLSAWFKIANDA